MILSLELPHDLAMALKAASGREKLAAPAYVLALLRQKLGVPIRSVRLPTQTSSQAESADASQSGRIREQAARLAAHFRTGTET